MTKALHRLQHWMHSAIADAAAMRGLATPGFVEQAGQRVRPSATLTAAQRLAIYNRSYRARLLNCFNHIFPALRHALGDALFHGFAVDYLGRNPPSSYSIDHLADGFPAYLTQTRPDRNAPAGQRESWCDFICELAALELEFLSVFDGPGLEDHRLPPAESFFRLEEQHLLRLKPVKAPCLRLFALDHPVHEYLTAVRREQDPALPAPARRFVAMTRLNYRVLFHELSEGEHAALAAIDGREPASVLLSDSVDAATLRMWLATWTAKGLLCAPG